MTGIRKKTKELPEHLFKKGQSGNPSGRPALPPDLKLLMKTTGEQIKRDICEVMAMDISELHEMDGKRSGITVGKAAIISCMNNTLQTGDDKALNTMLNRILGKPVEHVVMEDKDQSDKLQERDQTIQRLLAMFNDRKA